VSDPARAGGEIENAVVDQIRAVLRTPEIIVRTWRAARQIERHLTEAEVREALERFDPSGTNCSRPSRRASSSSWSSASMSVWMGSISGCGRGAGESGRRRGGRKLVITPDGASPWAPPRARVDSALIKALARAFRWRKLLETGSLRHDRRDCSGREDQ
jgi:hypothetical protein